MKKILNKWEKLTILSLTALLAIGLVNVGIGSVKVQANNTAQTLPFSQNWTNTGLITTNDDWSGVPGIVGYLGDIAATSTTNVDPRTLLADYSTLSAVDVIANQTNPDTLTSGGVAEFDGIANPTIALQGSGTADAPFIVVYLNTTGKSNIVFACNIRDVDGSADDAVQQVDVQYRVGGTGDYTSVPGGYIADATTGGTAIQVTALSLTLPAAANNQALVEVRVITTNAIGSDEWVGVDDINVTAGGGGGTPPPTRGTLFDFTGNGRTDWTVLGNINCGSAANPCDGSPIRWKLTGNPASPVPNAAFKREFDYGFNTDRIVPQDYTMDNKTELVVRRPSNGIYYVSQFPNGIGGVTLERAVPWGNSTDNAGAEGDYDGDGKADYTVVRVDQTTAVLTWYVLTSSTNTMRAINFGSLAGVPNAALFKGSDFNGDGREDFVFALVADSGAVTYYVGDSVTGAGILTRTWGNFNTDVSVTPADYTGDGKSDLVAVRESLSPAVWFILDLATNTSTATRFGISDPNFNNYDFPVRGDYDGDGKHDIAVWRPSNQTFYVLMSSNQMLLTQMAGNASTDRPLAFLGTF